MCTPAKEEDIRSVFRSAVFNERRALALVKVLQLEVARVPARAAVVPVIEQEQHSPDARDEVEREREHVAHDAVLGERLEGLHERALDPLRDGGLCRGARLALADKLTLCAGLERGIEDVGEGGLEEERAREEGDDEERLGADDNEGDQRGERAGEDGEDGHLRDVGEEGEYAEDDGGGEDGLEECMADGEDDLWVYITNEHFSTYSYIACI